MILETNRLILRPWKDEDADNLYLYAKDPEVGPATGWKPHQNAEESLHVIRTLLNGPECYAICQKSDGKPIGSVELMLNGHTIMVHQDDECELGYWLGKPFWGQGIMTEAVHEMLRHAFEDIGMKTVWVCASVDNTKSQRVQEKCGFRYQKTMENIGFPLIHEIRTQLVRSLTREQWRNDRIRKVDTDKKKYLSLLLLADEQEDMVDRYLESGTMFVLEDNGIARCECVVTEEGEGVLEIKNIAVDPKYQGKGYGRTLIDYVAQLYRQTYTTLQVGTGDSPLTIPFYEKCGFTRHHILPNFFTDNYDHPIFECGKQLVDMVFLRKPL